MSDTPSSRTRSATRDGAVLADALEDHRLTLARQHHASAIVPTGVLASLLDTSTVLPVRSRRKIAARTRRKST